MGAIKVTVDDKPIFEWDGNATEVANILSGFPQAAKKAKLTPQDFANNCLFQLRQGRLLNTGSGGQEMQMTAVIWLILTADTGNPQHPGKVGDYVSHTDFDVDIEIDAEAKTFRFAIDARSKFSA
jgi:hypothetical protein